MTTEIELEGKTWKGTLRTPSWVRVHETVEFTFDLISPGPATSRISFRPGEPPVMVFPKYADVSEVLIGPAAKGKYSGVTLTITDEKAAEISERVLKVRDEYITEQAAVVITSWQWAIGGDSHMTHIYPEPSADTPAVSEIQKFVQEKAGRLHLEDHSHRIEGPDCALYTPFGWWEISDADLQQLVTAVREEIAAKKKAADDAKQAKYDAALMKAKETGKPAILNTWMDKCNDSREECDMDEVIEYVYPDGHRETKRFHTW